MKHEKEFYQEIFAFSISHNYRIIKIYDYYSIIDKEKTIFYYYSIKMFDFISENNKEK